MAYRTKVYKELQKNLLKPIMDFDGIMFDTKAKENFELYRWIDCDYDKKTAKPITKYLKNEFNEDRIYINIDSYEKFVNYRLHREEYEYFNPFAKYKNTLYLLLLMVPVIYDRYCKNEDNTDTDAGLVDLVVNDEVSVTQEEILKHVNVKQYPVKKDEMGNPIYRYDIDIARDSGDVLNISSEAGDKIISIWMLILKILDAMDETPNIVLDCGGDFRNVQLVLTELFEKYTKERDLNRKDIKKIKPEDEQAFLDNTSEEEAILTELAGEEEAADASIVEDEKPISITDEFKNAIPINTTKMDDDEFKNFAFV